MTTQKRGSEKLFSDDNGLCALTEEELLQVAGMGGHWPLAVNLPYIGIHPLKIRDDIFPHGTPDPRILGLQNFLKI